MIHSFVLSEGKLAGRDLELEALRLVRADKGLVLWIDLENPTDEEAKAILEGVFQFHPVAIEDCLTPSSLPKIEDYDEYLFLVLHGVNSLATDKFATIEFDAFLGKDYLVTFHRAPLRSVQSTIDKVAKSFGVVARGPDRLLHNILDQMVDNYYPALDELRVDLEAIEEIVLKETSSKQFIPQILKVRTDFSRLRQVARPQRDVIERLARGESRMIRPLMLPYFRDLRDNLVRLEESASSYHDRLLTSFDIHLNKAAFEANEGIKFLTAITAVTLPGVLVGTWYGMNFERMPELKSDHGYLYAVVLTIVLTLGMIVYLKRRRWF